MFSGPLCCNCRAPPFLVPIPSSLGGGHMHSLTLRTGSDAPLGERRNLNRTVTWPDFLLEIQCWQMWENIHPCVLLVEV